MTGTDENQTFNVKFEKITPYLDYSHYQGRDDLNNGNYHGAEVKVNEKVVDPNGNTWETNIDGQSITMTVYSEVGVNDTQWILDAFAVNGQAVTVPEDSDGASSTGIIYDQQGDPIANVEITVEKEEKRNWFWGNVEGYARTYTIRFTNVASYLKITNFNLRASGHSEVVVQSLGEGLSLKSTPNGQPQENVGVNGLIWNSPAQLEVTPEFGYYMSEAVTSDGNASLGEWSGEWYGTQNAEIRFSGGLSYLDISSEKVPFHFSYSEAVDELGVPIPDSDGFTLGQTDYFSKAITSAVPKYPGGDLANPVFAGWRLGEEEGLYSQNSSISRETLQKYANNSDVIQYEENASLGAKIVLEPVFVDAAEAVLIVDHEAVEQRMVHTVKLHRAVVQQQGNVFAHLDHRAEVGTPQPAAEEPAAQRREAVVELRVEGDDADPGIGQHGPIIEMFGVVVLHVEVHGPRDPGVERAVEFVDPFALGAPAEEHRVRQHIVGRAQLVKPLIEGEEVDRHKVALPGRPAFEQPGQFAPQRGAVAEDGRNGARTADRTGPPDVVAEILLPGHDGQIEDRFVEIAHETVDFFECGHTP